MQKTLSDFWAVVASKANHPAYRNQRYGQIVSNTLSAERRDLSNKISSEYPLLDPFHKDLEVLADDPMFVAFCEFLEKHWSN